MIVHVMTSMEAECVIQLVHAAPNLPLYLKT